MTDSNSPFQPGARVAVMVCGPHLSSAPNHYVEDFVDKVLKNGNFTLKGSRTQWRADSGGNVRRAHRRGNEYGDLLLWDAANEPEIARANEAFALYRRWQRIVLTVEHRIAFTRVTPEACDLFEKAIAALKSW